MDFAGTINRVKHMLCYESVVEVHARLVSEGLSTCDAHLLVVAAQLYEQVLPADYEECGECGYDHEYEPEEARVAHEKK